MLRSGAVAPPKPLLVGVIAPVAPAPPVVPASSSARIHARCTCAWNAKLLTYSRTISYVHHVSSLRIGSRHRLGSHTDLNESRARRNESRNYESSALPEPNPPWLHRAYPEVGSLPDEIVCPSSIRVQRIMRVRHDLGQLHESLDQARRVGPSAVSLVLLCFFRGDHDARPVRRRGESQRRVTGDFERVDSSIVRS
jgi:hypothetical protein